jgi:hypothetical protein
MTPRLPHFRLTQIEFDRSANEPIDARAGLFGDFPQVL